MLWGYDAVRLYLSDLWDEESIFPRIETGFAYTKNMNSELVEKFNNGVFSQGSASLKFKFYNPKNLIVQHLPVQERENKIEINRMRNGYIIQILLSVDIQKIVKIGGKVIENYVGVIYRENFQRSPFKEVNDNLFSLREKYKNQENDVF